MTKATMVTNNTFGTEMKWNKSKANITRRKGTTHICSNPERRIAHLGPIGFWWAGDRQLTRPGPKCTFLSFFFYLHVSLDLTAV